MIDRPPRCPTCGGPLRAAGEPCPACLVRLGLEPFTERDVVGSPDETRLTPAPDGGAATVLNPTGMSVVPRSDGSDSTTHPATIGPYRIVRVLGEGGMGVVYLAEQTEPLRRQVALKVIKLGMDTRDVVARFEAERQTLALMDHPNIASVFDAGATADGRPYFVMEYVVGAPLTEYSDDHRLPMRPRLELFTQVCAAVQHAHQKGIIHRDLKPSNVIVTMVDGQPVPKVIDFGIAKATDQRAAERANFTQLGVMIGTPEYMSPEQADPSGMDLDTRTDVYSLGVILYELLIGVVPFSSRRLREAGFSEMIRIIREEEPPRPSTRTTRELDSAEVAARRQTRPATLTQQLRGDLDWITLRALEKNRARRYPTVTDLAADIARFLNHEPVNARPPALGYRVGKFVRRNRLVVSAAAIVLVAILGGLIVSSVLYVREGRARRQAVAETQQRRLAEAEAVRQKTAAEAAALNETDARKLADAQRLAALEQRSEAERQRAAAIDRAYVANVSLAAADLDRFDTSAAWNHLRLADSRERPWEWRHLELRADASLARLNAYGRVRYTASAVPSFGFASDGARVYWNTDETVQSWDAATYRPVATLGGFGGLIRHLHPDGSAVIVRPTTGSDRALRLVDVVSKRTISTLADSASDPASVATGQEWVAFSADGQRFAAGTPGRDVRIWDTYSGRLVQAIPRQGEARQLALDGQGHRILIADEAHTQLWDVDNGRMLRDLEEPNSSAVAFSSDGLQFATAGHDSRVRVWRTNANTAPLVLDGHRGAVYAIAFNRAGTVLATTGNDTSVQTWDLTRGTRLAVLTGFPILPDSVAFNPQGDRLLAAFHTFSSGEVLVWDATVRSGVGTVPVADVEALTFSPDGQTIALGTQAGALLLMAAGTRDVRQKFQVSTVSVTSVVFSPRGDRVAWSDASGRIELLDPARGTPAVVLTGHKASVTSLAFDIGGTRLASTSTEGTVTIWDAANGRVIATHELQVRANAAAFVPSGGQLIVAVGDPSRAGNYHAGAVWDWRADRIQAVNVREGSAATTVSVSRDGRIAFAGSGRPEIYLWNDDLSHLVAKAGAGVLNSNVVSFTPDGGRMVTGSWDGTVRVWDAKTGDQVLALRHDDPTTTALAVSPDGARIASSDGRLVYIWNSVSADELAVRDFLASVPKSLELVSERMAYIRQDRSATDAVRNLAMLEVERQGDNPERLSNEAHTIAIDPARKKTEYQRAVRLAEAASRIEPWVANDLTTYGLALYRAGEYQKCVDVLNLETSPITRSVIAAMAHYRLGHRAEAQRLLDSARAALAGRSLTGDLPDLMPQALALIEGKRLPTFNPTQLAQRSENRGR